MLKVVLSYTLVELRIIVSALNLVIYICMWLWYDVYENTIRNSSTKTILTKIKIKSALKIKNKIVKSKMTKYNLK